LELKRLEVDLKSTTWNQNDLKWLGRNTTNFTIRYDTMYYLHWKTDGQAASLI